MDKSMIKLMIVALVLGYVASGCGRQEGSLVSTQVPATARIATTNLPNLTTVTVCGKNFIEIGGQVEDNTGAVVQNGSYSVGGFYTPTGMFIPECAYMILNGYVCAGTCHGNRW